MPARLLAVLGVLTVLAACGGHDKAASADRGAIVSTSTAPAPSARPKTPSSSPTVSITVPSQLQATGDPNREVLGADVSWPQCPKGMGIKYKEGLGAPMPLDTAKYVVLGLTNGPGFHANPCLADQVAWVKQRNLLAAAYSVISYPSTRELSEYGDQGPFDAKTTAGRLQNAGYQQAVFNIATMRRVGLGSPIVWLDVESVPHYDWPGDPAANAAVVSGAARGYRDAGVSVGVYSTPYIWKSLVGDLRLGVPEWRAAGQTSRAEARSRCGTDWMIQGGTAILSQWVEDGRDQNITCPGTAGQLLAWFHQY